MMSNQQEQLNAEELKLLPRLQEGVECPSPVDIVRLAELPEELADRIGEHISKCEYCADQLERSASVRAQEELRCLLDETAGLVEPSSAENVRKAAESTLSTIDKSTALIELSTRQEAAREAKRSLFNSAKRLISRREFWQAATATSVAGVVVSSVRQSSANEQLDLTKKNLERTRERADQAEQERDQAVQEVQARDEALREVKEAIELSQIRNAIRIEDFSASGRNTIRVRGSIDPLYVKQCEWTIREGKEKRPLKNRPAEDGSGRLIIEDFAAIELGTGTFRSVLQFEPSETAPSEFFPEVLTTRERSFLASFDGLITDPVETEKRVVASLDYIVFKAQPNHYKIGGRISRELLGKNGWFVAFAARSRVNYVLSELFIDSKRDPPTFTATGQLGLDRLDGQDYQIFVLFSDVSDALYSGQQFPDAFLNREESKEKFERSQSKAKTNDGTDGFSFEPTSTNVKEKK